MRNALTVNYNTQELTDAMIRSLNKQTPGCKVYVFDNSDREPYVNGFENVEVIDNTERRIIDLEEWLSSFPDKYKKPSNNYGSAKHCKSVDLCFDLIGEDFVLLDSDVLIKKDISEYWDENYAASGSIVSDQHYISIPRLAPYCCYINVPMCLRKGVRYFNGMYMWKLNKILPNRFYDTGAWFLEELRRKGLPMKELNVWDYVLHMRNGSWRIHNDKEWLEQHKELWL